MAIYPARETLTKQDVAEILRQNVRLYKDEPNFADYLTDLGLYLVEQLQLAGVHSPDLSEKVVPMGSLPQRFEGRDTFSDVDLGDAPPSPPRAAVVEAVPTREEQDKPATAKLAAKGFRPVFDIPPPVEPGQEGDEEVDPTTDQIRRATNALRRAEFERLAAQQRGLEKDPTPPTEKIKPAASQDPEERRSNTRRLIVGRELMMPGALTPLPEGGLGAGRRKKEDEDPLNPAAGGDDDSPTTKRVMGPDRARVYKVARSYGANEGEPLVCPICGTDTKGSHRCPSCGHII